MNRALLLCLACTTTIHAQWTTSRMHGSPEAPRPCIAEQAFAALPLHEALELIAIPGAHRFVAVEKSGKIWSFKDAPNTSAKDLLIDLKPDHPQLQFAYGIAFHPRWRENGHVFLCYAYGDKVADGTKLARFKLTQQDPPVLDPTSETVLLSWRSGGHNGASLQFGPDGMLYISTGDSEVPSPPDPLNTGQDISDLLSSILRIDVDHAANGKAYAIPQDNPFLKIPNARPEVWAFGFRNPWKISFDAKGRLWCGDVGWELWEMIHLVQRGGNHGWSAYEASQPIKPETQRPEPIIPPVAAHPHTEAASITGGYVYYGARFPELRGAYIYGDYETGKIWALWHDGKQVTRREEIADTPHKIVTFGQSEDGELYWMNWENDTRIYRLTPNPAVGKPSQFPRTLSATGLFSHTAMQTPATGVLPFEINEPMWQDGAIAQRFVALPEGKRIKTTTSGNPAKPNFKVEWPADSVLARTILLAQRRIETQVLHYDGETWNGYSYHWNKSGTDADLVDSNGTELNIELPWRIHGRAECARCHNNWSGFALGFQPDQLISIGGKKAADVPELFDGPFLDRLKSHLVSSRDTKADLETRARSWLHTNCAHCHRRHGGGSVPLMVNFDLPTAETMMLNEKPTRGNFALLDARIISPRHPEQSVLLARIARSGNGHMPMIGAREIDPHGFRILWDWIGQGEPTSPHHATPSTPGEALIMANLIARNQAKFDPSFVKLPNPDINCYFERFLPPDQRVKTLGMNIDAKKLLTAQGDAKRGSELLSMTGKLASCLACHIVNGSGHDFGPDLSQVSARLTRDQILESLDQPSKVIAKGYETWVVTLQDDSMQTGFVVNSTATHITLKLITGQPQTIARDQIKKQQPLPTSLMPTGLLQTMTEQEAADIIAYLAKLKSGKP